MARHAKTARLIDQAVDILREHHQMTVRQVYYQLVSRQVVKNDRGPYQAVSKALVAARQEGTIDVLRARLREEVERHMDMEALQATLEAEEEERAELSTLLTGAGSV